jgi:ribosomal protein S1
VLQPGDVFEATVFATAPFGIFVRHKEHPAVDILIKVTEVSWALKMSPSERASVGDTLLVRVIHVGDETSVLATIVGEEVGDGAV